ncbi:MAG: esterase-like activity of phytase family protein, partial [Isosphaeraceae bacterium]
RLPEKGLPSGIIPVRKRVLIDLLDPKYGLTGKKFPEKIEGLAKGPDTGNGQKTVFVASDNDFETDEPIRIWWFAISPDKWNF